LVTDKFFVLTNLIRGSILWEPTVDSNNNIEDYRILEYDTISLVCRDRRSGEM